MVAAAPRMFDFQIVLASQSPRRRELMQMLVPDVHVALAKDGEESYPSDMAAEQVPEWLARLKAAAYMDDMA